MKKAYLTIDEFPSEDGKDKIDHLVEQDIRALLFCRGDGLEQRMEYAVHALEKGFILGNHTYSHPDINNTSLRKIKNEIEKTEKLIEKAYQKAGKKRPGKYIRFPGINRGGTEKREKELQKYLEEKGFRKPEFREINYQWYYDFGLDQYIDVGCTYDTEDWKLFQENGPETVEELVNRMDNQNPEKGLGLNYEKSRDIIMMHDHPFTDRKLSNKAFYSIIKKLKEKGIKLILP